MKLSEINEWLVLIANIGVLLGIVFLSLEIRQNTKVIEREMMISSADAMHGQFIDSEYLPGMLVKLNNAQSINADSLVQPLMSEFDFTEEEAHRWWRYLAQTWIHNQADWIYNGKRSTDCQQPVFLLRFRDQQLFFDFYKRNLDQDYLECILAAVDSGR